MPPSTTRSACIARNPQKKHVPDLAVPQPLSTTRLRQICSEACTAALGPATTYDHSQTNTWNYNGDEFEKGFQVKDIKIQHLTVTDVNPTLEEVTKFASGGEDGVENIDLKSLAASLKISNANVTYLPGDVAGMALRRLLKV